MNAGLVFSDWPLMNGTLMPVGPATDPAVRPLYEAHVLHRYVAGVVLLITWATAAAAWKTQRSRPAIVRMALAIALVYPLQAVIGGLQVFTLLAGWTQVLHLGVGAILWGLSVALAVTSYCEARMVVPAGLDPASGGAGSGRGKAAPGGGRGDSVRAYIALTKPRIIELLLITTIPAMVLATRDLPGMNLPEWLRLATWTMVCGSLAAGSANAINQYLDRDIDLLMSRTRRRPLPAHDVTPENALVFGIVLGVISIALMAWFVNLVAAFLTLLAIGFYVLVYTIMLKRSTPQNIVIGGAAGALPPVIGWAAVTGRVEIPALLLFALVFYWTPPHFWALALRIRKDYEAASVPMLPVVKGVPETARQIGLYTVLLVAISLVFYAVAGMGPLYLVAAVGAGCRVPVAGLGPLAAGDLAGGVPSPRRSGCTSTRSATSRCCSLPWRWMPCSSGTSPEVDGRMRGCPSGPCRGRRAHPLDVVDAPGRPPRPDSARSSRIVLASAARSVLRAAAPNRRRIVRRAVDTRRRGRATAGSCSWAPCRDDNDGRWVRLPSTSDGEVADCLPGRGGARRAGARHRNDTTGRTCRALPVRGGARLRLPHGRLCSGTVPGPQAWPPSGRGRPPAVPEGG